jgi:hypothetical protein
MVVKLRFIEGAMNVANSFLQTFGDRTNRSFYRLVVQPKMAEQQEYLSLVFYLQIRNVTPEYY